MIENFPFEKLDEVPEGPVYVAKISAELWRKYGGDGTLTRLGAEVAYWASHREPIFHANAGELQLKRNDYERYNNDHLLYFSNVADRDEFVKFFEGLPEPLELGELFPSLDEIDLVEFQAKGVTMMSGPTSTMNIIDDETLAFWFWTRDNCKGRIWVLEHQSNNDLLVFENDEDFALYKLKFHRKETVAA
jgi:hypothetical protein